MTGGRFHGIVGAAMATPNRRRSLPAVVGLCVAVAAAILLTPFANAATKRAFVQVRGAAIETGSELSVRFGRANADGNLIVAYVVWDNPGAVALTDSSGNEWESVTGPTQSPGDSLLRAQIFYARDVRGGSNTVTATFSSPIAARAELWVHEYAGLSHVVPVDGAVDASGDAALADTGEVTTHSSQELLFAAFASNGRSLRNLTRGYNTRVRRGATLTADAFSSETGAYRAQLEQTGSGWIAQLVAFSYAGIPPRGGAKYPLKRGQSGGQPSHYLVDQDDKPFLLSGDSPQSLMVNLSEADARRYFANRQRRGFNAAWVNLICNDGTGGRGDAKTYDGVLPFSGNFVALQPNEQYFARVDEMLRNAASYGITVLLNPAETIGWVDILKGAGTDGAFAYGQYLGRRYRGFDNIVWLFGNDFQTWSTDGQADAVVQAVARGIRDTDPAHLQTVQLDFEVSGSLDDASWAPLIDLNATYTYAPTYAQILFDYHRGLPTFLIEANYDLETDPNESPGLDFYRGDNARPPALRKQAWWTMLSGATGHVYGNGYVWPFRAGWQRKLDTKGALQMGHMRRLLESLRWYQLVPDESHSVVTAGLGDFQDGNPNHGGPEPHAAAHVAENDYVTAAATPDGTLALAYVPTLARAATVDLTRFAAPVTARWFDPTNGRFRAIPGSPFANDDPTHDFLPPGPNGDKAEDWVLVLEAD